MNKKLVLLTVLAAFSATSVVEAQKDDKKTNAPRKKTGKYAGETYATGTGAAGRTMVAGQRNSKTTKVKTTTTQKAKAKADRKAKAKADKKARADRKAREKAARKSNKK